MSNSYKNISFGRNYAQTYLWKTLSVVLSFCSVFIVIPFLTSNQELYGIYTFCISFQMYLSYADIGFLSAGQKYAAEEFAKGNRKEEMNILGFVGAVLLVMIIPFSVIMLLFAYNPNIIINGVTEDNIHIVKSLFIILAIISPIQIVLQRLTQSILTIRVKDYISSRVDLVGNIIKILSTFWFFQKGRYLIVEYFIFINIITIACSFVVICIIKRQENYEILAFLKSIKFSKKYFDLMKNMSFTALGMSVSWVLCYELDLIYIGKVYSVIEVAQYAVCFTIINFLRNFFNIIFGPFSQRFNHFVALNEIDKFRDLLRSLVKYSFPICLFVCSIFYFSAEYFMPLWVGREYYQSASIISVLIFFYMFYFVSQPGTYVCIAMEQYRLLNLSSVLCPLLFIGMFALFNHLGVGVLSFAIAKIIMSVTSALIMYWGIRQWTNVFQDIKVFLPLLVIVALIGLCCHYLYPIIFPVVEKNKLFLLQLLCIMGIIGAFYMLIVFLLDKEIRLFTKHQFGIWKK